jgi:hypothetical protein
MEAIGWTAEAVNVPVPDDEDLECTRCGTLAALVEPVQAQELRCRRLPRHIDLVCRAIRSKR